MLRIKFFDYLRCFFWAQGNRDVLIRRPHHKIRTGGHVAGDALDAVKVHYGLPVRPKELVGGEAREKLGQGLRDHPMAAVLQVGHRNAPFGEDITYVIHGDHDNVPATFQEYPFAILHRPLDNIQGEFAQLGALQSGEAGLTFGESPFQVTVSNRFQQIVSTVVLEGFHRVFVVCRSEDYHCVRLLLVIDAETQAVLESDIGEYDVQVRMIRQISETFLDGSQWSADCNVRPERPELSFEARRKGGLILNYQRFHLCPHNKLSGQKPRRCPARL